MQFTVLIVDDEPSNIRILSSLLSDEYKVLTAKSGIKALEIANQENPDLILLDVLMPELSGFDVIKKLKSDDSTEATPVIFITALNSQEDEEQGLKLGAVDYIHKPFHQGIVLARVKNQLELVRHKQLLEQLANLDALTELPNRRKWKCDSKKLLQDAIEQDAYLAVGILDVDHFKLYNDHYGHPMGDIALQKLSKAVKSYLNQRGGELYRFGGEEFVFILKDKTPNQIEFYISQINQEIEQLNIAHIQSSLPVKVLTASIGVCLLQATFNTSVKRMLETADDFLYQAKAAGRGQTQITKEVVNKREK